MHCRLGNGSGSTGNILKNRLKLLVLNAQGLFLEGAGWDAAAGCLCEPPPLQLLTELPTMHLIPAPAHRRPHRGTYACPLYTTPARSGTADGSGFVASLPLKDGGAAPDHWVLRGTALLLALAE